MWVSWKLPEASWIFNFWTFSCYQRRSRVHIISLYFACIKFQAQQKLLRAIYGLNYRLETRQFFCKIHVFLQNKVICFTLCILLLTLSIILNLNILIPYPDNHNNTLKWHKFCCRDNYYPPTNPICCLFPGWDKQKHCPESSKERQQDDHWNCIWQSSWSPVGFLGNLYENKFVLHLIFLHDRNDYIYESTVLTIKIFQKNHI